MLINNNILILKDFILDLSNKKAIIINCNIKTQILIKLQN